MFSKDFGDQNSKLTQKILRDAKLENAKILFKLMKGESFESYDSQINLVTLDKTAKALLLDSYRQRYYEDTSISK